VPQGGHHARNAAARIPDLGPRNGSKHRQRPQVAGHLGRKGNGSRAVQQEIARLGVAAMPRAVDQRPECSRGFRTSRIAAEQPGTDSEQDSPTPSKTVRLRIAPRERLKQRKPRIFQIRQFLAADATTEQLTRDGAEARLARWRRSPVEFLEPLAPPGEADRAERRVAARRDDVGQREVEVPEGGECRPNRRGDGGKRRQAVRIERPLSDR
jgi:hypothetical protein